MPSSQRPHRTPLWLKKSHLPLTLGREKVHHGESRDHQEEDTTKALGDSGCHALGKGLRRLGFSGLDAVGKQGYPMIGLAVFLNKTSPIRGQSKASLMLRLVRKQHSDQSGWGVFGHFCGLDNVHVFVYIHT